MTSSILDFLGKYHRLPDEAPAKLASILQRRSFQKKEHLLEIGQVCHNIYFIEKGVVRVYYLKDGVECCSGLLCEGGVVISVNSFFNRQPSYEFIQAIEDTEVQYITYTELESLYRDFMEFNIIGRRLITEYYVMSEDRNYMLRGQKAQEKFHFFQKRFGHLMSRVPRKDIASYLGITLETLSRLGH